jgi:hypothetical protein
MKKNLLIKQTYSTKNLTNHGHGNPLSVRSYSTLNNKKWFTKASEGLINPISLYNKKGVLKQQEIKPIFTMDLETVYLEIVKSEVVIAISSCGVNNGVLENKIFLIDPVLLNSNYELATKELWNKYFNYLESLELNNVDKLVIFAHNLGDFAMAMDGYFLYKGLMSCYNPENLTSIIDESNSFISIKLLSGIKTGLSFEFKDSLRIFPMSLDKLCAMFGVNGKSTSYHGNPKFNSLELFNNPNLLQEFVNYSLACQDAKALYEALLNAQHLYFNKFKVDIESVYSTPSATLSLKIIELNSKRRRILYSFYHLILIILLEIVIMVEELMFIKL